MKTNSRLKFKVFLLITFLTLTIPAVSQLPFNWTKLPGENEKALHDLASFSPDTLFVLDTAGNILATFDGGNTWKERNPQTGKELKFNALRANPNLQTIVAVGNDDAIYRSTNMGESWEPTYSGSADAPTSFYAITDDGENYDASVVYAVGDKGTILKSTNDGEDWEKKELNIEATQDLKFVSFFNVDTGFVANENGIIRTFDGGNSWKTVSTESGTTALSARAKPKCCKSLEDIVKLIDNNGTRIQHSSDYGTTWTKDSLATPCELLASGGVVFDKNQCDDLYKGQLIQDSSSGSRNRLFILAGSTFKGVLQPKWENVELEGVLMVMRRMDDQTIIAETLTESNGRFDLEIPASVSGDVEIVAMQAWDQDWCPRPLPFDFDTTLEPMEECDESTLPLQIISPESVKLNDLTFKENEWIAVGNQGIVLRSTDPDDDGDGLPTVWLKENSRTNQDLLATARGIEKSDIRRGFYAAGNAGTIVVSQTPGFELVAPVKTDSLCAGTEITISWTGGDPTWNVIVSVIDVNSWTVAAVVNPNTLNDGNETWNIPPNFPPGLYQAYVQEVNYTTWAYGESFSINYCPTNNICLEECDNNLLLNWNFNNNAIFGPMAWGSVSDWTNSGSPDVSTIKCNNEDTVSIGMWGNQANAEFIFQTLNVPFIPGKTYSVSFMGKWHTIPNRPYPVQFEFRAYNTIMNNSVVIGVSSPLAIPEDWVIMTLPDWTATGSTGAPLSVISVSATNHSSSMQPDSTSYGIIGAICITEKELTNVQALSDQDFELGQSFPNPFESSTIIEYSLSRAEKVTLKIYNLHGKEIETLVDKIVEPGTHRTKWNATKVPAGIYLYKMQAGNFSDTKRTIMIE